MAASTTSNGPDPRQIKLIAASATANEARIREVLAEEGSWTSQADRDALRQALVKVATRGNHKVLCLLLEQGADVNPRKDNETPPLFKAAEGGYTDVAIELLRRGADPSWRNRNGQTALFPACMRGHNGIVKALLDAGADVDGGRSKDGKIGDKEGRTPLLFLASEKPGKWNADTLKLLLDKSAHIDARDSIGRTALLWAATNGNAVLAEVLLSRNPDKTADISAYNNRGKTALHLASEGNHLEVVKLLLKRGARPDPISDGGWTPLHNACQNGHQGVVTQLLAANANVNAKLSNEMTPLHWAAFNGEVEVVKLLLGRPETNISIKDDFDRTPMLCAAERHHNHIVRLLSPARAADRLSKTAQEAAKLFHSTIVDFGNFREGKKQLVFKHSVHDLLYGWDNDNDKPSIPILTRNIKYQPSFRWIHIPANNIAWTETLLAKAFIEGGHRDIEGFKALEKCFDQEHRGPLAHANFMRTYCQRVASQVSEKSEKSITTLPEDVSELSTNSSQTAGKSSNKAPSDIAETGPSKSETKKKSKAEQISERHPTRPKRTKGHPGNPPGTKDNKPGGKQPYLYWESSRPAALSGKMVLFMPFLHYETDERQQWMAQAIRNARAHKKVTDNACRDELLIHSYLNHEPPLHPRRTLDQFFYHGIDTTARDRDQVVYRHCEKYGKEKKMFMVDQIWLFLDGETVITCFPERWMQPKQDPLNVIDGIIEETNAKTRPPVQSVYDLAMLITSRCSGMFDRHRMDNQDFQFLDIFESSIGSVTDKESQLFSKFHKASAESARWLARHRRGASQGLAPASRHAEDHVFPDALLNIDEETNRLAEIKDIRDELNIIAVIINSQILVLSEFENSIAEELRVEGSRRSTDALVSEIKKRSKDHMRLLQVHRNDIERMDHQAQNIYMNLTHLLDLKQKHSNALEARFARDQAVIAAKQGQTIMVFTIVTIIFLPMSFIAAFFAINFEDWNGRLTMGYVSKYMFGIGLAISFIFVAMAFTVTDISDAFRAIVSAIKDRASGPRRRSTSQKDSKQESESDKTFWGKTEAVPVEVSDWRRHRGFDSGLMPRERMSRDRDYDHVRLGLSPIRYEPRRFSGNSGHNVNWARPSFDRDRVRSSDDLERGRGAEIVR